MSQPLMRLQGANDQSSSQAHLGPQSRLSNQQNFQQRVSSNQNLTASPNRLLGV